MKVLRSVLFLLCICLCQSVYAQESNDTARLFATIKQLQEIYKQKAISFDIRYTYASELKPEAVLDSLTGQMDISGASYHYVMSGTEMTANERYVITLFGEDKIMYLSKPLSNGPVDPLDQMWASMKTAGVNSCAFTESGNVKSVNIGFRPGGPYKEMKLNFDRKTGYLMEMKYVLKTEMLMTASEGIGNVIAEYGEYAIVRCTYKNYRTLVPRAGMFDENRFFYKEDGIFKPTGSFSEYRVFQGSPNL